MEYFFFFSGCNLGYEKFSVNISEANMGLSKVEMEQCREAFLKFDKDGSGTIDSSELKATLQSLGQSPTDEELFDMIAQVDEDASGEIEFSEFLQVISLQKEAAAKLGDETDTLEAFAALGGNIDKSGHVDADKLSATILDFGLTIDINGLIAAVDTDRSGKIEYDEFKEMLR